MYRLRLCAALGMTDGYSFVYAACLELCLQVTPISVPADNLGGKAYEAVDRSEDLHGPQAAGKKKCCLGAEYHPVLPL